MEKDEIIGNAIALIAPSEWEEPFGRIVIEAYQVGTPVIASVLGGLKELVEEGRTGFRFEAGNVEELEACISRISSYTEEELYELRRNCVNLVEKKFTEEAYFNNFCSIMKWRITDEDIAVCVCMCPNRGSEPGVGWNWAKVLSKNNEVYVIIRGKK